MAANQDKVVEKARNEVEEKIKVGKTREEIAKELHIHNVEYKLKDKKEDWILY